jgi:hypothetical protein
LLVIDQQGLGHFFPLVGGLCKFYANAGGKRPIQRQQFLVQYKQQGHQLLSMHDYTSQASSQSTFINKHLFSNGD